MADAINELKSKGIYRFENKFDVDLADGTVLLFAKDKRTILTNMESALLYALIKAYEEEETHILTHTAACDFMGWSIKVESQAPEAERQFLRDLQKKIDPEKELIESISGKGYRLTEASIEMPRKKYYADLLKKTVSDGVSEFQGYYNALNNNIHLTRKGVNEGSSAPSIETRMSGCDHLVIMNYAATSFFSSEAVGKAYSSRTSVQRWFYDSMSDGTVTADVILLNPHSEAAREAAINKMKPSGMKLDPHEIISHNIQKVIEYKKHNLNAKVNLFLTDVALPYGISLSYSDTQTDGSQDIMKVDLYSPLEEGKDSDRPSFFLRKSDPDVSEMFRLFEAAVEYVKKNSVLFEAPCMDWLTDKVIVHRGRYYNTDKEHSLKGFWHCLKHSRPMEIDIMELNDGELLVGRDTAIKSRNEKYEVRLSDLTSKQLKRLKDDDYCGLDDIDLPFSLEDSMLLSDFLAFVDGKVPLLIELKLDAAKNEAENEANAKTLAAKFIDTIRYYSGQYAVHCANPYVLKEVKTLDPCIPCGQISWSFRGKNIPDYYRKIHEDMTFIDIVRPDFISYKREDYNEQVARLCRELSCPLIFWGVTTQLEKQEISELVESSGVVAEGGPHLYL